MYWTAVVRVRNVRLETGVDILGIAVGAGVYSSVGIVSIASVCTDVRMGTRTTEDVCSGGPSPVWSGCQLSALLWSSPCPALAVVCAGDCDGGCVANKGTEILVSSTCADRDA